MPRSRFALGLLAAAALLLPLVAGVALAAASGYPETARRPVTDVYHGIEIVDPYRWLEKAQDPEVQAWTDRQEALTRAVIDELPQRAWLVERLGQLIRYDDEGIPRRVLDGERIFYSKKDADQEKWVYMTRDREGAEPRVVIDPNAWPADEQLAGTVPSRDGKLLAFGKAKGGNENPVVRIMVVETGEVLPDTLRGWKQSVSSWLPDGSGFYYSSKPLEGTVPEGEHEYWVTAWLHRLGTPASEDEKVFWSDETKELWHGVAVTDDGRYIVYHRGLFNKNDVYFKPLGSRGEPIPLAEGLKWEYDPSFVGDTILIRTDENAPRFKVYVTDAAHPQREHWREWLPEHERDTLEGVSPIAGHVYASYLHDAQDVVRIHELDGTYLRDLPFPTIGTGGASGLWAQPEVWVSFSSFTYPSTTFKYRFDRDELEVYRRFPVPVDVESFTAEQVWYESKDGTRVPMFVVHRKDLQRNGDNPTMLYGYGGFNISQQPGFSTTALTWIEAGGVYAVACLRGGGEYGRDWHEAGMREKKQNVFDDFIAAAEYLIAEKWTRPERLAIRGGSNGGLLVGAVTVQRPDLFRAVHCAVPLLDMVIYHKFGFANVWAEEYGSSDDPEQFAYIRAYSPYQNVKPGVDYPAFLVTGSENDARVDPLHARKMCAALQAADPEDGDEEPIVLLVYRSSGHGGGTTITKRIEQTADPFAFLMDQVGLKAPR